MKQKGIVIECDGKLATVEVKREEACQGCKMSGACYSCAKTIRAVVVNKVGAKPGDEVDVEAPSGVILGYAFFVFVLPIVAALALYLIGDTLTDNTVIPYLMSLAAFVLSFVFIYFFVNRRAAKNNRMEITGIINVAANPGGDNGSEET